jgi:hypothetical protein
MQVYLFLSDMRRIRAIFFWMLLGVLPSLAQQFDARLLVGANFSQVDGDRLGGYNKLGLNTGIQISRKIQEDWNAAFELRYSMKGSKKVIDPETFDPTLKISFHYIEVPLIAEYQGFEKIKPYGGLSAGVNVFNQRDDNGIVSEEQDLRVWETSVNLGAVYFLNDRLGVDLRHTYSLTSIRKYPLVVNGPTWFGRAGWYNRLFTLGLTYKLER